MLKSSHGRLMGIFHPPWGHQNDLGYKYVASFFPGQANVFAFNRQILDDEALACFLPGHLEGAVKRRVVAILNAFKQTLVCPTNDWCMDILRLVPMNGTYNQVKLLDPLKRLKTLFSYDLLSKTDHFPLAIQESWLRLCLTSPLHLLARGLD